MYSKLTAILLVLVLANVVNYGVNKWLDQQIPGWLPPVATLDGSALSSSQAYEGEHLGSTGDKYLPEFVHAYYQYLDKGGEKWLGWRNFYDANYGRVISAATNEADQKWRAQILRTYDRTGLAKYGSLALLLLTFLLFFGNYLKEQYWWTPVYYLLLIPATAALYSSFSAPFFLGLVGGGFLIYALMLRLTLPIYTYEWAKSLRPFLTFIFFLLAMMAFRGPEWLDYLFWTSPIYRLVYLSLLLLTLLFHWSIIGKVLTNARLDIWGRVLGYAVPLGTTAMFFGLTLGFYAVDQGGSPAALNQELLLFSPDVAAGFDSSRCFVLFFAGVVLLISGGIGYSIQRIAR